MKADHFIICCICKNPFIGYGNNAEPVVTNGICCNECNLKYVIPERLKKLEEQTHGTGGNS